MSEHVPQENLKNLDPKDLFRAVELWIQKLIRALDKGEHNRHYAQKVLSLLPLDMVKLTPDLALSVAEIQEPASP